MFPDVVDHVWLFGSHARGNQDQHSDIDILVVSEVDCSQEVRRVLEDSRSETDGKFDVSFYTWGGIEKVINSGALFGWHLKLEGKPIFDKSRALRTRLDGLRQYANHIDDMETLITCTEDCIASLQRTASTIEFDAGVLATAARNAGIILSTYLDDIDFSQHAPFALGLRFPELEFPLTRKSYDELLAFRYASERGETSGCEPTDRNAILGVASAILNWQRTGLEFLEYKNAPLH